MHRKTPGALRPATAALFLLGFALLTAVYFLTALLPEGSAHARGEKVEVCHIPPDDPFNFHTITVGSKALPAHLAHADLAGACNGFCAEFCDDGDACTVDDTGDCEEAGCPVERDAVDCDDDDLCTIDSCDSVFGCEYEDVVCVASDACHVASCNGYDGTCVETPVSCDPGFVCDPEAGCVPEPEPEPEPECPCFDAAALQAENPVSACGDLENDQGQNNGVVSQFQNGSQACAGNGGCLRDGNNDYLRGCFLNTAAGLVFFHGDVDYPDAVDAVCRALIEANCQAP